jgi:hypothetical protein
MSSSAIGRNKTPFEPLNPSAGAVFGNVTTNPKSGQNAGVRKPHFIDAEGI